MTTSQHSEVRGWLTGRLPEDWFTEAPEVVVDREEITIVGRLAEPDLPTDDAAGTDENAGDARAAALAGRIREFRERTREQRIGIARELEHRGGRKVAWGAVCGDRRETFTSIAVPAMTRLRQPERQVLDTLVAAGVARSRSEALAWCVRLVGRHTGDWLDELRTAMHGVEQVRESGPDTA